jgi:crotonobetainyl-CoA:carnitine CoA-transferase CaiB-like acyl-CoA transferase
VRPLAGVRVCDLSTVLAGPYCTMVLGDLGAEVIKVEPPDGDATRGYGPPWVGDGDDRVAAYFLSINRNKRSLRLDLRSEAGREVLRRLVGRSDVLVENFRPGGMARLGLAEEELQALNPDLVHLAISGFGPTGPDAAKPGYDFIAQAVGGLMSVTGFPHGDGGRPTKVGVAISDIVTGLFGCIAILAALRRAEGERIDASLLESTLAVLINQAQNAFVTGTSPERRGNAHPNIVPYETFATADGEIAVGVGSERQWPRLCRALELDQLAQDSRFANNDARVRNREVLRPLLAERLAERTTSDWLALLDAAEVPVGPVNDVVAAFDSPQSQARQMRTTIDHPRLGRLSQVGFPFKLATGGLGIDLPPPLLGEHTDEVLAELGYGRAEIDRLRETAVI